MLGRVVVFAIFAGVVYLVVQHINNERKHERKAREWGCQPPARDYNWYGIKIITDFLRALREERAPDWFIEWQERNATTNVTRFFDADVYQTYEPANIQAILATQFDDFKLGFRLQSWSPMFGKGIFTTDGSEWKHRRAVLRPQFAREILQDLETEERHHGNMLRHISVRQDGWTDRIDLQPLFMRLTMDSSTELLFGQSTESQLAALENKEGWSVFNDAYERGLKTVGFRNFLEDLHWLYNPSHYKHDIKVVHAYLDRFVQDGLRRPKSKQYCFFDELVKETKDPVELRDELMNILVAGRDTTSSALGWTFYLLARNADVLHKLRQIVVDEFGMHDSPKNLDFASIKGCTYLQHVLNEVLRLYPPVPANARTPVKDTTLPVGGGPDGKSPVYLRKGQSIAYFTGAMHRRKDLWGDDGNEFRPERWIGRKVKWDYLPFSGGPRMCLGQQQALTLAGYTIIRLLQKFDNILSADDGRARRVYTLTDAPATCWVRLRNAPKGEI